MALYKCDPRKHPKCRDMSICQKWCFMTVNPEYSIDGKELSEEETEEYEYRRRKEREAKNGRKLED